MFGGFDIFHEYPSFTTSILAQRVIYLTLVICELMQAFRIGLPVLVNVNLLGDKICPAVAGQRTPGATR